MTMTIDEALSLTGMVAIDGRFVAKEAYESHSKYPMDYRVIANKVAEQEKVLETADDKVGALQALTAWRTLETAENERFYFEMEQQSSMDR